LRIAREGLPFIFGMGAVTLVLNLLGWWWSGLAALVATLAVAAFFRDPDREAPESPGLLLSPADGRVVRIDEGVSPEGRPGEQFSRVSIFMSPLNVHVNRIPWSGEVLSVKHTPGRFLAAYTERASFENERTEISLRDATGRVLVFVQIAGFLARRIVCHLLPGQSVERGTRFGLIMFGSRVDVYMPPEASVRVRIGDHVRAGVSVLGELSP
jgi:phosphatidylserine decarboxylase